MTVTKNILLHSRRLLAVATFLAFAICDATGQIITGEPLPSVLLNHGYKEIKSYERASIGGIPYGSRLSEKQKWLWYQPPTPGSQQPTGVYGGNPIGEYFYDYIYSSEFADRYGITSWHEHRWYYQTFPTFVSLYSIGVNAWPTQNYDEPALTMPGLSLTIGRRIERNPNDYFSYKDVSYQPGFTIRRAIYGTFVPGPNYNFGAQRYKLWCYLRSFDDPSLLDVYVDTYVWLSPGGTDYWTPPMPSQGLWYIWSGPLGNAPIHIMEVP